MVLILGNYIGFSIKSKRGLPAFNPAGSNRMLRFAKSLKSVDEEVMIISPASAMRLKWTGKIFHKNEIECINGIKIHYCSTFGLPFISTFYEQFSVLFTIRKLVRENKIKVIMVYCYYPSSVWASLYSKYFLKVKIVEDLEDVCVPKLSDWKKDTEANPIQQLVGGFLMKIIIFMSDLIIIPTANFLPYIRVDKKVEIISGCIDVPNINEIDVIRNDIKSINVLFSGALEDENGIPLFLNFLKLLNNNPVIAKEFSFHISGHGSKSQVLKDELLKLNNINTKFYGFLTESDYTDLLGKIKIALVLQNPSGRYALLKTPSKGYEYMSNAKLIIVSKIGDFEKLPNGTCMLLEKYNETNLYEVFVNLNEDKINLIGKSAYIYSKENWDSKIIGARLKNLFN